MTRSRLPVVAGVDGSAPSTDAALWAAREADLRGIPLRLLLVNDDPGRAEQAAKALAEAASACREQVPGVQLAEETTQGHPIDELVRRSAMAELLVVGSRGHGGFVEALLGSVSASVAMHGACPVVVVRGHGTTGPVVVGVDNSRGSRTALDFAFEAASRCRTDLVAVQALPDAYFHPGPFPHPDRDELRADAERHLAEQLSGWASTYPDVPVRRIATNEHPVAALREAAADARLLVVGHRGRGGFTGLLLGSVAAGALHHAPCPVAVIRSTNP
ncbi:nucleotide-binding universal stress UspA family protein [Saccharopolyspora erythraea NRRL 2338]|uniref:UspA n=1 Tax=Saccharopolyspora erythraea (strain ATCC 11635 / DSM 40517 / JCM 4748 / NBRC 13426 / NCIMB 8594 / NRRL 2338) TaxID=405948 RepID=A4FF30_SACEN|nr:universal stress protein [Saccharopolyspora erythraea]EQD81750.1 universal stress protein [Saccharopolyspora erythraea D]PFG96380.1 nucleotide-binding universal stress UspA family protein [Saccharopolyspora erythraea NRRL 2338]QRK92886.1 universal stress protein [Saccharopolyspora erythraea]CAM02655.1 UspA [Saccharopolyspora erythraea NRRL 2338]